MGKYGNEMGTRQEELAAQVVICIFFFMRVCVCVCELCCPNQFHFCVRVRFYYLYTSGNMLNFRFALPCTAVLIVWRVSSSISCNNIQVRDFAIAGLWVMHRILWSSPTIIEKMASEHCVLAIFSISLPMHHSVSTF